MGKSSQKIKNKLKKVKVALLLQDINKQTSGSTQEECIGSKNINKQIRDSTKDVRLQNITSHSPQNDIGHCQINNKMKLPEVAKCRYSTMPAVPVLKLQKPAPFFEGVAVLNDQFVNISINDYKGQYLVLFFYPLDFTFVCPTEIIAFSERNSEFNSIGCQIVGCSTDSQYSHLAWMKMDRRQGGIGKLNYPLLSDKNMSIARSYGVLDEDTGIPFRGLFIIDANQNLRQITINDLPVGRNVDETLRSVQAFQYTDLNGEVCPANWKPGSKTIIPDPKRSMEYFSKAN